MFVAVGVGWLVTRIQRPSTSLLAVLAFAPIAIPGVLLGAAIYMTYLYLPLPISGSITIMVIAYLTNYLPFSMIAMRSGIAQMHPSLEEASLMSGATGAKTFLRVTGPLLMPAFMAGWIWLVAHVMRDMNIAPVLASPENQTIGAFLWQRIQDGNIQQFSALSVCMVTVLLALILTWQRMSREEG
ncbi:ABC transporter permease [Ornithinimicrobium murale]|uniref:ABC transporter permease n=1 Tax=Ornithinimicrobium murale TaxID=1050153 RepID=UPI001EDF54BD|nr:ABC transporter permease subunit [Ornithinimicrobium murale]